MGMSRTTVLTPAATSPASKKAANIASVPRRAGRRRDAGDEFELAREVTRRKVRGNDAFACGFAHPLARFRVAQQRCHSGTELTGVRRVVDEQPGHLVFDLVLDPAESAADRRPRLPHRFRNGEPEPLRETLLYD